MKEVLVTTIVFASLMSVGTPVTFAQPLHPPATKAIRAETEVRRLNGEEVDAFLHSDAKAMEQVWSDDMVVTNPLNKFVTKQQVLGMVQAGVLVITSLDRQIEYLRVYGDTVIVAGSETVVWGGKMPNAGKTEHLRFTGIWMKQRGHWQEVARHANVVAQQ
jgi:ketosteroid isomerase-like protein